MRQFYSPVIYARLDHSCGLNELVARLGWKFQDGLSPVSEVLVQRNCQFVPQFSSWLLYSQGVLSSWASPYDLSAYNLDFLLSWQADSNKEHFKRRSPSMQAPFKVACMTVLTSSTKASHTGELRKIGSSRPPWPFVPYS